LANNMKSEREREGEEGEEGEGQESVSWVGGKRKPFFFVGSVGLGRSRLLLLRLCEHVEGGDGMRVVKKEIHGVLYRQALMHTQPEIS